MAKSFVRPTHGSAKNLSAAVRYGSSRPVRSVPVPVAQVEELNPPVSAFLENESRFPLQVDRSGPLFCGKASNARRRASTLSGAPSPRDDSSGRASSQPPSSAQSRPSPSSASPLPQRPRSLSQIDTGALRSSRCVGDEQFTSVRPRSIARIRHSIRIVRPSNFVVGDNLGWWGNFRKPGGAFEIRGYGLGQMPNTVTGEIGALPTGDHAGQADPGATLVVPGRGPRGGVRPSPRAPKARLYEHPEVVPQLTHLWQLPLGIMIEPHSGQVGASLRAMKLKLPFPP